MNNNELVKRDLYKVVYGWALPILEKNEYVHQDVIRKMNQIHTAFKEIAHPLREQIIHRDMHLSNVIFKDNEFQGFIDFELLESNVRVFDLCYCCTSILSELYSDEVLRGKWQHIISTIFEGYNKTKHFNERRTTVYLVCHAFDSSYLYYLFCSVKRFIKVK